MGIVWAMNRILNWIVHDLLLPSRDYLALSFGIARILDLVTNRDFNHSGLSFCYVEGCRRIWTEPRPVT